MLWKLLDSDLRVFGDTDLRNAEPKLDFRPPPNRDFDMRSQSPMNQFGRFGGRSGMGGPDRPMGIKGLMDNNLGRNSLFDRDDLMERDGPMGIDGPMHRDGPMGK